MARRTAAEVGVGPNATTIGEIILRKWGKRLGSAFEHLMIVKFPSSCLPDGSVIVQGTS
jgi:hypothetical protein